MKKQAAVRKNSAPTVSRSEGGNRRFLSVMVALVAMLLPALPAACGWGTSGTPGGGPASPDPALSAAVTPRDSARGDEPSRGDEASRGNEPSSVLDLLTGEPRALPMDAVVELTVSQVEADYAARRYTAAQLTRTFLDRIARYEDHYNAFISMNPRALAEADSLDRLFRESGPVGPLHGVPVVVKDNMDMAGLVTTAGSKRLSGEDGGLAMIPGDDAAVVERLRRAGAIILGKTNLPDFAGHGTRTNSSVAGVTLNPYNTAKAPGGSSGGTATAVNASFAVLGLGTETGGSIENPASAQALVGVKPTYGLVPLEGIVPVDATYVDVAGPLARTVRDAAIALDVLAGPTPDDPATFAAEGHLPEEGYAAGLATGTLQGKRFGLVGTGWRDQFLPLAPETEAFYRDAIQVLEGLGAEVVEDPFEGSGFKDQYRDRPRGGGSGAYDWMVYLQGLGPESPFHSPQEWEALTGEPFPARSSSRAPAAPTATEAGDAYQAWRMELRAVFRKALDEHELDGLFFPQAGAPIPDLVEDPERPDYNPNDHPELPSNIINALGVPVVTLPFGYYDDGTPFVLAFIGRMWSEADLLAWAFDLEQATRARIPPTLEPGAGR